MAEGTGLLNRRMGFSCTEGSNPSLSAVGRGWVRRVRGLAASETDNDDNNDNNDNNDAPEATEANDT